MSHWTGKGWSSISTGWSGATPPTMKRSLPMTVCFWMTTIVVATPPGGGSVGPDVGPVGPPVASVGPI